MITLLKGYQVKIALKAGEHVRVAHDQQNGCFMVYLSDGYLHIKALEPGEGHSSVILGHGSPKVTMETELV